MSRINDDDRWRIDLILLHKNQSFDNYWDVCINKRFSRVEFVVTPAKRRQRITPRGIIPKNRRFDNKCNVYTNV